MGSALALAAVTALLKHLLENGLAAAGVSSQVGGDAIVSALAPDRIASGEDERPQLNLFLYLVTPRAGLNSNGREREGRGSALALDLHYLLTAYGAQDLQAEILLGYTLQVLHDCPVLERERIRTVLKSLAQARERRVVSAPLAALGAPEVADGFDRLVIEPEFMNAESVSKLWSALQARYRPSATYKVSAVLIPGAARTRPVARATPQPSLR